MEVAGSARIGLLEVVSIGIKNGTKTSRAYLHTMPWGNGPAKKVMH